MAKNDLHAFCTSRGYHPPLYQTTSTGPPHDPRWTSTVYLTHAQISLKMQVDGQPQSTKKGAEHQVASAALRSLAGVASRGVASASSQTLKVIRDTALIVDVENLPKLISELPEYTGPLTIYAFIGKHHPLASADYDPRVIKILSSSTRQDGTDTCIQVHIGIFLSEGRHTEYLIATRDHFGSALVDMIQSNDYLWGSKRASIVTTIEHIITAVSA